MISENSSTEISRTFQDLFRENNENNERQIAWTNFNNSEFVRKQLIRIIASQIDDQWVWEEILQDTLLKVYLLIKTGAFTYEGVAPFKVYVKNIAINCARYTRRRIRQEEKCQILVLPDTDDDIVFDEEIDQIAYKKLTKRQYKAYKLMKDGFSDQQIAQMMNIQTATVRSYRFRIGNTLSNSTDT